MTNTPCESSTSSVDLSALDLASSQDSAPSESIEITTAQPSEKTGFTAFGFSPEILEALEEIGYRDPSLIQQAAIPELMLGRDLVGQAQTGTGKTAAFALPMLAALDENQRTPQVLVLTPTRELAIQVADSFKSYAAKLPTYGCFLFTADQISAIKSTSSSEVCRSWSAPPAG